jgi:dihydroxy-acid dehydratase
MEFNTISVSDGITMGTEGMRMSLVSREVIADSIELVARANHFDALVILVGCDKTIPGAAMALARLDVPGVVLYGGSIAPGRWQGHDVTIQDVYEAVGAFDCGRLAESELTALENSACPGPAPAGSSPRTRWRRRWSSSACRPLEARACRRPIRSRRAWAPMRAASPSS